MPDPTNEGDQRRREAESAALLAMLRTRRYDLPAMVRQAKTRTRPFRQIRPTNALKANLAAPHFAIVRAWAAQVPILQAAYGQAGDALQFQAATNTVAVSPTLTAARSAFAPVIASVERWHRGQWISRVRASTGLDVSLLTQPADVAMASAASVAWNQALADDLHQQIGHELRTAALVGLSSAQPVSVVAPAMGAVIIKARHRAARIADDQVEKFSRAMDRGRRDAAGLTRYVWHHTQQPHPRHWHRARDGQTFGPDDIETGDRAGQPPFCKCWEEPLFT
jgi:hypothetical protein